MPAMECLPGRMRVLAALPQALRPVVDDEARQMGKRDIGRSDRGYVTLKISSTIAGVNMRLGPNGVRELHWHQQITATHPNSTHCW